MLQSDISRKWLLELARKAIGGRRDIGEVPGDCKGRRACFVTLTISGRLRGCVGNLEAAEELYKSVASNAVKAAFEDPRFLPVDREELAKLQIEISILEEPKRFDYESVGELVDYLERNRPGVIVRKGWNCATFLPQVWEQLSEVEDFMGQLCLKAGLEEGEWTRRGWLQIETYTVEVIK